MNRYEIDDLKGRHQFKNDFNRYYIIQDTGSTDRTDIMMTGRTALDRTYQVELKKRYLNIHNYSGSTLIEENKLNAFREIHRDDPQRKLIYFNYYLDNHYIAFDITGRLDNEDRLEQLCEDVYPVSTSIDKGNMTKKVRYLSCVHNECIQDKLFLRKSAK